VRVADVGAVRVTGVGAVCVSGVGVSGVGVAGVCAVRQAAECHDTESHGASREGNGVEVHMVRDTSGPWAQTHPSIRMVFGS